MARNALPHCRARMSTAVYPVPARRRFGFPRLSAAEWKSVLFAVKNEVVKDRLTMIAGDIAFSGVIAIFPVLIAIIFLYGLVFDPHDVARQLHDLSATLPGAAPEEVESDNTGCS